MKEQLLNDLIKIEMLIEDLDKPDRKEGLKLKLQEMLDKLN